MRELSFVTIGAAAMFILVLLVFAFDPEHKQQQEAGKFNNDQLRILFAACGDHKGYVGLEYKDELMQVPCKDVLIWKRGK